MTMFLAPYTAIADIDGSPLDAGFLFFGEYGKDPELFPVEVFWDADFTVPAAQPIRTRNGYPVRNGSPTKVYLKTAKHSIAIKNKNSAFILVDFFNKGWDASFVVDSSGKNQQEINDNVNIVIRNQDTALSIFKALSPTQVSQWKDGITVEITNQLQDIVGNESGRTIWLPKGRALVTNKIHIGNRNVKLKGDVGDRYTAGNGTFLQTNFDGTLFELGNPIPEEDWASNLYAGVQGFKLEDLCIYQSNRNTPLNNGNGNSYGSNSIAVQDWGGGDLNFRNVQFEGFKHAVWGLQSDINTFYRLRAHYNKQALFFTTKCQQLVIEDIYAFFNDTVIAGSMGSTQIIRPVLVGNGSETDYDIDIYCGSNAIRIVEPWLETLEGTPHKREAYIRVGGQPSVVGGSTSAVNGFEIVAPFVYTNLQSAPNTTKHLVDVGRAIRGIVDEPSCPANQSLNLAKVVNVLNDSGITNDNCQLKINGKRESPTKLYNNAGSTSPNIAISYDNFGSSGNLNGEGRHTFGRVDGVAGSNFMLTSENQPGQFQIRQPTYTGGQTTRFHLQRSYQDRSSIPTSGSYEKGDYIRNINPSVLGTTGSQYFVKGWIRLTTGSNHVLNTDWAEERVLTGT